MGADSIQFIIEKKATWSEIENKFRDTQAKDRDINGHREGYSGDFQTVDKVLDHRSKVFTSYNEAMEYCLEKAEKWTSVVAVYYHSVEVKSTKLIKINDQIKVLTDQLNSLSRTEVKLTKFVTCKNCKSRVSTVHYRTLTCPVCRIGDFRPVGLKTKIERLKLKIEKLRVKHSETVSVLRQKQITKQGDKSLKTLVAGWGAC